MGHANKFYTGDNLYILNAMDSASVDLIYLDPPFNSKRLYSGTKGSAASGARFKDVWSWDDVDSNHLDGIHPDLLGYFDIIARSHSKGMKAYCVYMTQRLIPNAPRIKSQRAVCICIATQRLVII